MLTMERGQEKGGLHVLTDRNFACSGVFELTTEGPTCSTDENPMLGTSDRPACIY